MAKKILIIIAFILLLIIGGFVGIVTYERFFNNDISVYVASHQLTQRKQISIDDLEKIKLPRDFISDDVYTDLQDIEGKYVKLSYSIPKGSLIYKSSLEQDIKDLANTLLRNNEVSYDMYTSDIKINTGNLCKNMFVDLYLTINNKDKPISDLLISNARIIGLYDSNNKLILDYDNDSRISIVSIAITKEAISILNKAQVIGEINCIVNSNTYNTDLEASINYSSELFDYLQ